MKSTLQLQLDNDYELLRVAFIKKAESNTPVIKLPSKLLTSIRLSAIIPATMQEATNWDAEWFNHYE